MEVFLLIAPFLSSVLATLARLKAAMVPHRIAHSFLNGCLTMTVASVLRHGDIFSEKRQLLGMPVQPGQVSMAFMALAALLFFVFCLFLSHAPHVAAITRAEQRYDKIANGKKNVSPLEEADQRMLTLIYRWIWLFAVLGYANFIGALFVPGCLPE